jgi:hypothetical protein
MGLSSFSDKTHPPTNAEIRSALGDVFPLWTSLLALIRERIDPIVEVWGFTSASTGWGLRVVHKKRVILYMTPQHNQFLVSFALGEKAVAAARTAALSASLMKAIEAAPRYAEGRGVRLEVKSSRQLPSLAKLAEIKWKN